MDLSVEKLIREGYLAEPDFRIKEGPRLPGRFRSWQDELTAAVRNEERNQTLVDSVEELLSEGCTSVLCDVSRVAHGERLESLIQDRGIDARFVYGETDDREEQVSAFKAGEYPVLISTLLSEGWDAPNLDAIVMCTPSKSTVKNIQTVGRCLRPQTEKGYIVDIADTGSYTSEWFESRVRAFDEYYGEFGPGLT